MLRSGISLSSTRVKNKSSISVIRLVRHRKETVGWCRRHEQQQITHIFKLNVSNQWHWQDISSDLRWKHSPVSLDRDWKPIYFIYPQCNWLRSSKASFIDCYEYWAALACRLKPLVYSADWSSEDRFGSKKNGLCICLWRTKMSSVPPE